MKKQPSQKRIFFSLIFRTFCAHANRLFPKKVALPNKIGKYTLEKKLKYTSNWNNYQIAIYKDNRGKKYFAKMWSGRFKDYEYLMLRNEENVLKKLNGINLRQYKNIKTPKVYYSYERRNCYLVLFEYIDAKSNKKSLQTLYKAIQYIQELGKFRNSKKNIQSRKPGFMLFTYFVSLASILTTNPRLAPTVLTHVPFLLKHAHILLKNRNLTLSHRDIHSGNLLNTPGSLYIIDFALCVYTLKYIDELKTLFLSWDNNLTKKEFEKKYNQLAQGKNQDHILYLLCAILLLTHLLSENRQTKADFQNYKNVLSYIKTLTKTTKKKVSFGFISILDLHNIQNIFDEIIQKLLIEIK